MTILQCRVVYMKCVSVITLSWISGYMIDYSFVPRLHPSCYAREQSGNNWMAFWHNWRRILKIRNSSSCDICHMTVTIKMVYTDVEIQLAIDNVASRACFASLLHEQRDSIHQTCICMGILYLVSCPLQLENIYPIVLDSLLREVYSPEHHCCRFIAHDSTRYSSSVHESYIIHLVKHFVHWQQ